MGIPGPRPHFIQGNCPEIRQKGLPRCHKQWHRTYGDVYGYYIGGTPYLVVGDAIVAKDILHSKFEHFPNRPVSTNGFMVPIGLETKQLIFQNGKDWNEQRSNWKSFFNPKNIEKLFPYLDSVVVSFLSGLELDESQMDIYKLHQKLTMEVIGTVLLGVERSEQSNKPLKVIQTFNEVLNQKASRKLPVSVACFPEFDFVSVPCLRLLEWVKNVFGKSEVYNFVNDFEELIKGKDLINNNVSNDFLTKMINLNVANHTLVADCFALLFGGFETISITLLHATRMLIKDKNIQEQVRKEIRCGELDYLRFSEMKYVDALLSEVLRVYNPVPGFIRRVSSKDYRMKGDILIRKNTVVQIPMAAFHQNQEHFEQPDEFKPERFMENAKSPSTFLPFGSGRRSCVASHFAMTTMKLVILRVVQMFNLLEVDDVQQDIPNKHSIIRVVPKRGLKVRLEKI